MLSIEQVDWLPRPAESELNDATQIGLVVQILTHSKRKSVSVSNLQMSIWPALRLQQLAFCFDYRGRASGFATWAFLSDEVAQELKEGSNRPLHFSEWNEGLNLFIIDVVLLPGSAFRIAHILKNNRLAAFERATAIRRDHYGRVKKIIELHRARPLT